MKRYRHIEKAAYHTRKALKAGKIQRGPCEVCGVSPAECHHIDYSDPDRIMWLCKKHHAQTHSQFGKPAPLDWMADIRKAMRKIDAHRMNIDKIDD